MQARLIVALLSYLFIITGCTSLSSRKPKMATDPVIEIAIMLPSTLPRLSQLVIAGIKDSISDNQKIHITNYEVNNVESVTAAVAKAVNKQTKIIVGPLFAELTRKVANNTNLRNVPIISLSNNPDIANEYIYTFGHAPLKATKFLITYLLNKNYTNFILLLPDNTHSVKFTDTIKAMNNHNLHVEILYYQNHQDAMTDVIAQTVRLVDYFNESAHVITKPVIYLADTGESLTKLLDQLAVNHLDKKALICGDYNLDIEYDKDIDLVFVASMNCLYSAIYSKAQEIFGTNHLTTLEKLAYDAGLIVGYAIGEKFDEIEFKHKLDSADRFITISGMLKFINHVADRKYDIIMRKGRSNYKLQDNSMTSPS